MPVDAARRRLWRTALAVRMRLLQRYRYGRLVLEHVDGFELLILPRVFNPKLLRSGAFFVEYLGRPGVLRPAERVLDLGTGSGASALAAARAGCSVVASDINPAAVRCTRINALLNEVESLVDVRLGDLFEPVQNETFDVVLFNPPYYRGTPRDELDRAWRSPDLIERFAAQLGSHLTPAGRALLVLSSDGEADAFLDALRTDGYAPAVAHQHDFGNEHMMIYHVSQAC
jgi:release factor glutamine methyltransferase